MLRLWVIDDFVDAPTVARLRALTTPTALAEAGVEQALDVTGRSAEIAVSHDPCVGALVAALDARIGLPNAQPHTIRFREYAEGQGHPPHLDDYTVDGARLVATALLYLDDTPEGGDTVFVTADRAVRPRAGRLAVWFDVDGDGRGDAASEHRSEPVHVGRKRTLAWFVYATGETVAQAAASASEDQLISSFGPVRPAAWRPAHTLHVLADDHTPDETVRLLREACEARGVGFRALDPSDLDPRQRLSPGDALYAAATSRASQLAEAQLFVPGVATFYRDDAFGPLRDVVAPDEVLARAGVPMPRGLWVTRPDRARLRAHVDELGGLPVVLRVEGGEGGVGVMRLDSWPALFSVVDHVCAAGHVPRLTTYVSDAMHWRLVVVGDAVVAAYPNPTMNDDFRSAPTLEAGDYAAAPPDDSWAQTAVDAVAALGYAFGGVDLLVHPSGRTYVLEVNSPCYFPQAQTDGGVDVAGPMVDWLIAKARRAQ